MLLNLLTAYTKYQRLLRLHAALAIMNVNTVQYMHTKNEAWRRIYFLANAGWWATDGNKSGSYLM